METGNQKQYWDNIYETKTEKELSWFQEYPATSIALLSSLELDKKANIIDIGGGDSHFVDALISLGYSNIYVLDISAKAIERAKARLGRKGDKVNWIISDITDFNPSVKFDFWHDRAAFHFLTVEEEIKKYVHTAAQCLHENAYILIGTFSENGPQKCSGLNITRYTDSAITALFGTMFRKISCKEEVHRTPFNTDQSFLFCCFKKEIKNKN